MAVSLANVNNLIPVVIGLWDNSDLKRPVVKEFANDFDEAMVELVTHKNLNPNYC